MNAPSRRPLLLGASLVLALAGSHALAEPKQAGGNAASLVAEQGQPEHRGQAGKHGHPDSQRGKPDDRGQPEPRYKAYEHKVGGPFGKTREPEVNVIEVRNILLGHRHLLAPVDTLPPGIRMNLARGKPLPPGIAKKLDPRLRDRLPYYEGYEWKQVGRDVVLASVTTGIIYAILQGVLD